MTALTDEQLREAYWEGFYSKGASLKDGLRAVAEAAVKAAREGEEPVGWQWLNTGHFRKKIPKDACDPAAWRPVYTQPAAPVPEQASKLNLDYLREMARLEARIRELEQASAAVPEGYEDMRKLLAELLGLYDQRLPLRERMELWERCRAMLAASKQEVKS